MSAPVLDERRGPIAVVRLNRPDKRNALDSASLHLLDELFTGLAADDSLRALVLSTTDPTALCAGADVGEKLDRDAGIARMAAFTRLYSWLDEFPVPIVVVAVGNCVGAGAELVAGADLRVAGQPAAGLGGRPARGAGRAGPARAADRRGRAKDLCSPGARSAAEARALGLVQRSAAAADAEDVALELAGQIAAQHPGGIRTLKRMFRELDDTARRVGYENELLVRFQQHGAGIPRRR